MPHNNKSSIYIGVSFHKHGEKYEAYTHLANKNIHIGRFDDEDDAARAVDRKRIELGLKPFNQVNKH